MKTEKNGVKMPNENHGIDSADNQSNVVGACFCFRIQNKRCVYSALANGIGCNLHIPDME